MKAVDVFEHQHTSDPFKAMMHLQADSQRYIHPHNYDWPGDGSSNCNAGPPVMVWNAGTANEVRELLVRNYQEVEQRSRVLNFRRKCTVTRLKAFENCLGVEVEIKGEQPTEDFYDVAIIAVGFGVERDWDGVTGSYWRSTELGELAVKGSRRVVVFGNGDGGLVDLMVAAFERHSHTRVCDS